MKKDWNGNEASVFTTLGASNHCVDEREENDYYATDPVAVDMLCKQEKFIGYIWECACGGGHISKRLSELGYSVISTDLIDRGYEGSKFGVDFLKQKEMRGDNIVTNPPYKFATEFVYKAMELLPENGKLCMFLKIQFLEGKSRKSLFELYPPKVVYISSSRIYCGKNGEFFDAKGRKMASAVGYAWYVWEKGYKGQSVLKWIN